MNSGNGGPLVLRDDPPQRSAWSLASEEQVQGARMLSLNGARLETLGWIEREPLNRVNVVFVCPSFLCSVDLSCHVLP